MFTIPATLSPWREIDDFQREVNRLFSNGRRSVSRQTSSTPPVNIWKDDDGFTLTAELPGVDAESVDLTVENDTVTIQGEFSPEGDDDGKKTFHRRERSTGRFSRTVRLPHNVDTSATEATYNKGVLTVKLHRPAEEKPRKVAITTA